MLSFGSCVEGMANSDSPSGTCTKCGRKVGKNSWFVHLSNAGFILHPASDSEDSQGFWAIGRECAKQFDPAVLVKN